MRYLVLLASVMIAGPLCAQHRTVADPELEKCLAAKTGLSGGDQVTGCYNAALARIDARLTTEEHNLAGKAAAAKVSAPLVEGMHAWRAYRESWCSFEQKLESDPLARPSTGLMCRYELGQYQLTRMSQAN